MQNHWLIDWTFIFSSKETAIISVGTDNNYLTFKACAVVLIVPFFEIIGDHCS